MTNNKKTFEEKIAEDLTKTGLPTEITVHKILLKRGWDVKSQYSFLDKEGSIRSCDFYASYYGDLISDELDDRYICQLFIECKKSNKPWVFYTGPALENNLEEHLAALFEPIKYKRNINNKEIYNSLEKIKNIHDNVHCEIAYFYQIPFIKQKSESEYRDILYAAEMQVLKAIFYTKPMSKNIIGYINIYPLILFNGNMFKCDLIEDKLKVTKINYVRYSSSGIPESKIDVLIDVITLDYLDTYLEYVETEVFPKTKPSRIKK
jgi:hypothetical protein